MSERTTPTRLRCPTLIGEFLVWGLVAGLGGPSGPALNPARDLGPRIVHALYPLKYKGSSQWWYSWVPVAAPIAGALVGVGIFTWLLG